MKEALYFALAIAAFRLVLYIVRACFDAKEHVRDERLWIQDPVLGLMNLIGRRAAPMIAEDREKLAPFFQSVVESSEPDGLKCDVLFLYGDFQSSGDILGYSESLMEIVHCTAAKMAVVASPNPPEAAFAGASRSKEDKANVVLVFDRNGQSFGNFFHSLFARMAEGMPLMLAWSQIVPQGDEPPSAGLPTAVMACGEGQFAFRYAVPITLAAPVPMFVPPPPIVVPQPPVVGPQPPPS